MNRTKLKLSLAAALITLASATYVAKPAAAATPERNPCTPEQYGFAVGFADGKCANEGYTNAVVTSCQNNHFTFQCYDN